MKVKNKIKLENRNKEYIYVMKKNEKIDINKKGFVKVWNHPMRVDKIQISALQKYYNIPEKLIP